MKKPIQIFNYSIKNSADNNSVDIYIDGEIVDATTQEMLKAFFGEETSVSYRSFRNSINESNANVFNVIINSQGGHVGDALAMHDLLVELQGKGKIVNTIGRGIVASSATLLLLSGNSPEMSANSWFMMHTVSGGIYGNVDQVENYAVTMRKFNDKIRDIYASKSGMRKEDVSKLMDSETWLTAQEAKNKGFVASVTGDQPFNNLINKDDWSFSNVSVLNSYNGSVKPQTSNSEDMKKLFADFATEIKNLLSGIKPTDTSKDNSELVNSISTAITTPLTALSEGIDAAVSTAVSTAMTAELKKATDPLTNKITELENEIVALKGKQTQSEKPETVVPIGNFNS